jgi:hypothetical protein
VGGWLRDSCIRKFKFGSRLMMARRIPLTHTYGNLPLIDDCIANVPMPRAEAALLARIAVSV